MRGTGALPQYRPGLPFSDGHKRLDYLASLRDGWLDGGGVCVAPTAIERARALLVWCAEHGRVPPLLYPTEDGRVEAQWDWPALQAFVIIGPGPILECSRHDLQTGAWVSVELAADSAADARGVFAFVDGPQ